MYTIDLLEDGPENALSHRHWRSFCMFIFQVSQKTEIQVDMTVLLGSGLENAVCQ